MNNSNMEVTLDEISEKIKVCNKCKLHKNRNSVVIGSGDPLATLMFVGESPGSNEDRLGIPFVGKAGILFTKMLHSIHLSREQVYLCNLIKCRPPNNRDPQEDEIIACIPYLYQQIDIIDPEIIVLLGSPAMKNILKLKENITNTRGKWYKHKGRLYFPTFHPAYLLRDVSKKKIAWEDLKKIEEKYRSFSRN